MSGHGSPPPEDRANHPGRQVSRPDSELRANSKGTPMQRIHSHSRSINNIEAKAGGMNIPVGHHLHKERAKHLTKLAAAREDFRREQRGE